MARTAATASSNESKTMALDALNRGRSGNARYVDGGDLPPADPSVEAPRRGDADGGS